MAVNLTLNTLIFDEELASCLDVADQAWRAGVDAFIVADLGLIARLREELPDARLHFSTQLSTTDEEDLRAAAAWGAARVTLARELTLAEIEHLCQVAAPLNLEVEVFAHGALCVCYSGQCLLSSMIGGRSANRGRCAQACRLPYELLDAEGTPLKTDGAHLLSPKDLCLLDEVTALEAAGVHSIKIEGRMKSADYVMAVTSVYREALDRVAAGAEEDAGWRTGAHERLEEAFSRGFTTGFFGGVRSGAMMSYDRPNNRGVPIGRVQAVDRATVTVKLSKPVAAGDRLEVWTGKGRAGLTVSAELDGAQGACQLPMSDDLRGIKAGDRIFRVRSAALTFAADAFEPRVPIAGSASYRRSEHLKMAFWPATSAAFAQKSVEPTPSGVESAILRRLANRWGADAPVGRAEGPQAAPAKTKELTGDEFGAHIDRLGQTPFTLTALDIDLDEGLGIGFSTIHHGRSDALEDLQRQLWAPWRDRDARRKAPRPLLPKAPSQRCRVVAIATAPSVAEAAFAAGADAVYTPAEWLLCGESFEAGRVVATCERFPAACIPILSPTIHGPLGGSGEHRRRLNPYDLVASGQPVVVGSLGALNVARDRDAEFEVAATVPLLNSAGLDQVCRLGAKRVWLSPELRLSAIEALGDASPVPLAMTVFGAEQLMVTEHCILMSEGPCDGHCERCPRRQRAHTLQDRKGYRFPVATDPLGRSHLYNSVPLDLIPWIGPLWAAGVSTFAVDTTLLSVDAARSALQRTRLAVTRMLEGGPALEKAPHTTTGHLFRGPS